MKCSNLKNSTCVTKNPKNYLLLQVFPFFLLIGVWQNSLSACMFIDPGVARFQCERETSGPFPVLECTITKKFDSQVACARALESSVANIEERLSKLEVLPSELKQTQDSLGQFRTEANSNDQKIILNAELLERNFGHQQYHNKCFKKISTRIAGQA
jgi:hypothetical protein